MDAIQQTVLHPLGLYPHTTHNFHAQGTVIFHTMLNLQELLSTNSSGCTQSCYNQYNKHKTLTFKTMSLTPSSTWTFQHTKIACEEGHMICRVSTAHLPESSPVFRVLCSKCTTDALSCCTLQQQHTQNLH